LEVDWPPRNKIFLEATQLLPNDPVRAVVQKLGMQPSDSPDNELEIRLAFVLWLIYDLVMLVDYCCDTVLSHDPPAVGVLGFAPEDEGNEIPIVC